ncbi:MAG: hypothetical protein E7170_04620 [Firmicutes bacterium]|nr:hypothetical protein [Bacillota bacterium]
MTDFEYNRFIYSCKSTLKKFNIIDNSTNKILLQGMYNSTLEDESYENLIIKNSELLKTTNLGTPFSICCYVIKTLKDLGIQSYLVEKIDKSFINFSVLYEYNDEYFICDLVSYIRKFNAISSFIIVKSEKNDEIEFSKDELIKMNKMLKDDTDLHISYYDYFRKSDNSCMVINSINNEKNKYKNIDKVVLDEFVNNLRVQKILKKTKF